MKACNEPGCSLALGHRRRGKPLHFAIGRGLWLSKAEVAEAKAGTADLRRALTPYGLDLLVECHCGAKPGKPCIKLADETVHFGRRLRRFLTGFRHSTEVE